MRVREAGGSKIEAGRQVQHQSRQQVLAAWTRAVAVEVVRCDWILPVLEVALDGICFSVGYGIGEKVSSGFG